MVVVNFKALGCVVLCSFGNMNKTHSKTPLWKHDGEEDKFIEKLIKEGGINKFTKPATLLTRYPNVFGKFSVNVVRNHLNAMKRLHCKRAFLLFMTEY